MILIFSESGNRMELVSGIESYDKNTKIARILIPKESLNRSKITDVWYDKKRDLMKIWFGRKETSSRREITPSVVMQHDENGKIICVEIMSPKQTIAT